jgi:hypothetical protein
MPFDRERQPDPAWQQPDRTAEAAPLPPGADAALALQRTAGNARVSAMLQRQQAPPAAPALPAADVLTTRIAQSIGVWETNRGGNAPNPTESTLDNVSGVPGNMATIEQATMPYALDAFRAHRALRNRARPPLTLQEIDAAIARTRAVTALLTSVTAAAGRGTTPDDFIAGHGEQIAATGLSDANVHTMFEAVPLRATIVAANARVRQGQSTPQREARAIPEGDRLGLGTGSLTAYVRTLAKWGENRAGWQRLAVQQMPNDFARRMEEVSESDNGTALVLPVVRGRVDAHMRRNPQATEQEVVTAVGAQNNSREDGYGANIWATYRRLYGR